MRPRAENRAAAAQLAAIGELFGYRLSRRAETESWAVDTEAAVSAEVAAELRISQGVAGSKVRYARAMRERLPRVGEIFKAGDIDFRLFATVAYLVTDPQVVAEVDARLAASVARWPSMTPSRLAAQVDKIVARADADAVRRRRERVVQREICIGDVGDGPSHIQGSLLAPDAHLLDRRLDALAAGMEGAGPGSPRLWTSQSRSWATPPRSSPRAG